MKLKITKKVVRLLDGTHRELVDHISTGRIIKRFDKTPFPVTDNDIICPHFLEFKIGRGCWFGCAWCYARGTMCVWYDNNFEPHIDMSRWERKLYDVKDIKIHFRRFLDTQPPEVLNTGELCDSTIGEKEKAPLSLALDKIITQYNKGVLRPSDKTEHKIMFVTKATLIENFLEITNKANFRFTFSINDPDIAKSFEKGAPKVIDRIQAGHRLMDNGFEVCVRIDPIVPIYNAKPKYCNLIDLLFNHFRPNRITLGSLRGLKKTILVTPDRRWVEYMDEDSKWGKKVSFNLRVPIYKTLIEYLNKKYDYKEIAVCKEPRKVWKALGLDWQQPKCVCSY